LAFDAARLSVEQALKKANLSLGDIGFFEYHDAFSIFAALSLEAAGFAPRSEGWKLAADGSISRTGRIPCATMGGLKARGFPGGATGVYQAVEAVIQLRGSANPSIQLGGVKAGIIQSLGGPASTAVTHILERI
jgi:acetyl-CoA C-acetyltransferase